MEFEFNSYSLQVVYGNESGWYDGVASGEATAYVQTYPDFSYVSGTFHHVRLTGLQANASYYFKCAAPLCWLQLAEILKLSPWVLVRLASPKRHPQMTRQDASVHCQS